MKNGILERQNVPPSNAPQMTPVAIIGLPLEAQVSSVLSRQSPFQIPPHPCIASRPPLALHLPPSDIISLSQPTSEQPMAVPARPLPMTNHSPALSMLGRPIINILPGIMAIIAPAQPIQMVAAARMEMDMLIATTATTITDPRISQVTARVEIVQLLK
jgi:hypothetical protein